MQPWTVNILPDTIILILQFLFLGKTKQDYLAKGLDDFAKRLKHFTRLEIKIIKEKSSANVSDEKIRLEEGRVLLKNAQDASYIVALDVVGRQVSSEELAAMVTAWESGGKKKVCVLIGGPLGLSDEVRNKADTVLSISRMTFTHEMARFLIMEQFYRAYTIKAGTGYHK